MPADYPHDQIPWRDNAFVNETGPTRLRWGDISGGIMEGAEAGNKIICHMFIKQLLQVNAARHSVCLEFVF